MNSIEEAGGSSWVFLFLLRTFFRECRAHNALRNEENRYCISCEMAACVHCLAEGSHADHKVITIYRLVYMDVVTLVEMARHLDCSRIQPYSSNGRLVVALSPLPHEGSGQLNPDVACQHCSRRLMNPDRYRFCSIACKYRVNTGKPTTKPKPTRPPPHKGPDRDRNGGAGRGTKKNNGASTRRRIASTGTGRRKGTPVRAPFY